MVYTGRARETRGNGLAPSPGRKKTAFPMEIFVLLDACAASPPIPVYWDQQDSCSATTESWWREFPQDLDTGGMPISDTALIQG